MNVAKPAGPSERKRIKDADSLIYHVLGQFNATTRSVEAFLPLGRQVKRLDSPDRWARMFANETKHLGPEQREVARGQINAIIDAQFERHGSEPGIDGGAPAPTTIPPSDATTPPDRQIPADIGIVVSHLARAFYIDLHTPARLPMFHRSLLTTQLSALEQLIGALFQAFLIAHPEAFGNRSIALTDLLNYSSVDEALEAAIEDEVDAFRRESAASWDKWFQERLGLKFSTHAPDLARLLEGIERRNVVVHNAGRVSRQYLARLKGQPNLPPLGTELEVDEPYLRAVLDDTFVFANLLAQSTWRKLNTPRDVDHIADDTVSDLMQSGRWAATRDYCDRAISLGQYSTESMRLVLTVNRWLALKRLGGTTVIEEEVAKWDVSALDGRFSLAREALLDHDDHLVAILGHMMSAGEFPVTNLLTWPLLEEFRSSPRYAEVIGKAAEPPDVTAPATPKTRRPKRKSAEPTDGSGVVH